jgi:hypothetical protein
VAESEESQDNVAAIRTHINNLEQMLRFQIGANPGNRTAVQERLSARAGLPALYLALAGGPKTQPELSQILSLNQSNISRGLTELLDAGLVAAIPPAGSRRSITYVWSPLERLVGVSRIAKELLDIQSSSKARVPVKSEDATSKRSSRTLPLRRAPTPPARALAGGDDQDQTAPSGDSPPAEQRDNNDEPE